MTELESTPEGGLADIAPEPRHGSQTRKATEKVDVFKEQKDKLRRYAQSKKTPMVVANSHFINVGVEYDIYDPNWAEKFQRERERVNAFAMLDEACPALQFVDDTFLCIWSQPGRPPQTKKLSKTLEGARQFCLGCTKTREIREGIADYETQIRTMKERAKQGVILKVPSCIEGGSVSEDLKKLYCRRTTRWMKVSKCKTLKNGMANCDALRWATVTVKGELPDAKK